jgi:hypothetical protein
VVESLEDGLDMDRPMDGRDGRVDSSGGVGAKLGSVLDIGVATWRDIYIEFWEMGVGLVGVEVGRVLRGISRKGARELEAQRVV